LIAYELHTKEYKNGQNILNKKYARTRKKEITRKGTRKVLLKMNGTKSLFNKVEISSANPLEMSGVSENEKRNSNLSVDYIFLSKLAFSFTNF
jgi:hypothetical protein